MLDSAQSERAVLAHHSPAAVHAPAAAAAAAAGCRLQHHRPDTQRDNSAIIRSHVIEIFFFLEAIDATYSAYPVCQVSLQPLFNASTGRDACSVEYCRSSGVSSKKSGRP